MINFTNKMIKLSILCFTVLTSNISYGEENVNKTGEEGYAETGPAKAAKESANFLDSLDRETLLGGKFSSV